MFNFIKSVFHKPKQVEKTKWTKTKILKNMELVLSDIGFKIESQKLVRKDGLYTNIEFNRNTIMSSKSEYALLESNIIVGKEEFYNPETYPIFWFLTLSSIAGRREGYVLSYYSDWEETILYKDLSEVIKTFLYINDSPEKLIKFFLREGKFKLENIEFNNSRFPRKDCYLSSYLLAKAYGFNDLSNLALSKLKKYGEENTENKKWINWAIDSKLIPDIWNLNS